MKINQALIDRGGALNRLVRENDDFKILFSEWQSRIVDYGERALTSMPTDPLRNDIISRRQELVDLKDWLVSEIEAGGAELERQRDLAQSPQATAEAVN